MIIDNPHPIRHWAIGRWFHNLHMRMMRDRRHIDELAARVTALEQFNLTYFEIIDEPAQDAVESIVDR